jgi:EAL domain-containing protein (putative c-di-GMP-specific phosphodiesterase class I)
VIVEIILDLAHKLGLRSVAEGVSDQSILKALDVLGCHAAQGYFLSRPMTAEHIPAFVHENRVAAYFT